jgi:serine protease Do
MIKKTLQHTQRSTVAVLVPHPEPAFQGLPSPNGTGFFVSKEGHLMTARHVMLNKRTGNLYGPSEIEVQKPGRTPSHIGKATAILRDWPAFDLALLKFDLSKVSTVPEIPMSYQLEYLDIEFNVPAEGEPVYSFGYPLPDVQLKKSAQVSVGLTYFCPRTTSAIISSHHRFIGPITIHGKFPTHYVIDKALNYGNSGGPIVIQDSGKVISVCVRFQPVDIPQSGMKITIPSLYGITTSLKNIEADLRKMI